MNMCDAVRQYAQEYAIQKGKESAINLYGFGMGIDMIAKALKREPTMVKSWVLNGTEMRQ